MKSAIKKREPKYCRQCWSEQRGRPEKGIHTCIKTEVTYENELEKISDQALRDRGLGLAAIIQAQASLLAGINSELWRRYQELKKQSEDYSEI